MIRPRRPTGHARPAAASTRSSVSPIVTGSASSTGVPWYRALPSIPANDRYPPIISSPPPPRTYSSTTASRFGEAMERSNVSGDSSRLFAPMSLRMTAP